VVAKNLLFLLAFVSSASHTARLQSRLLPLLLFPSSGGTLMTRRRTTALLRPFVEVLEGRWVPTTLTPTTFLDGGLGSGSLRDAVLQFNADTGTADDIIQLEAGTYSLTIQNVGGRHETAGLTGDLNLTRTSHRWIIQGAGPSTIIDASQLQDRVFQIVNPGTQVIFQDLVIQGGLAQDNGADGTQAGTTDALGGGILNIGGEVTLENVVVQNNGAQGGDVAVRTVAGHSALGGGLYSSAGALTVREATIANNEATGGRGGDSSRTFYPAGAGGSVSGAGLYASGGSLDISDSTIANNRATGGRGGDGGIGYNCTTPGSCNTVRLGGAGGRAEGGGLYVTGGSLTVASSAIASNQGAGGPAGVNGQFDGFSDGGGLYTSFNSGMAIVTGSTLSGNSATYSGGGIYNGFSGTLTVSNSILSGNTAGGGGGGIYNGRYPYPGTLTVSNSTLSGNSATYSGGGIYNDHGTLTVNNSTLSGNSAYLPGGGIYNTYLSTLTVSNSTLSGNFTTGINSDGGGIDNGGTLTLSNSTLSGNSAGAYGGGIDNVGYPYYGTLTVSNSTLSGNSAGYGGGIYTPSTNPATLTNVTLTANRATYGGGVYGYGGLLVLHNTLIAGNFDGATGTTPDDISGALDPSGDYNLIGDGTGMTGLSNGVNGNLVGSAANPIDPLLGPLDDNGGPTLTHALLSGSPAIDAGNNAYATDWDQRGPGFRRIVNGTIDIGAFEVQAHAHGRPTGQPLPDPLPVQALATLGAPLLGQPPGLPAAPSPLPDPASVPTDGGNPAPSPLLPADAGMDQPVGSLGPWGTGDLDPLAPELPGGS
jgi:hypothetical protein